MDGAAGAMGATLQGATVCVSDELRLLFRAWRRGVPLDAPAASPPVSPPLAPEGEVGEGEPPAPSRRIRLRRDGRRPLAFDGAPLMRWAMADPSSGSAFTLDLHLTAEGGVVAGLALTPAAGGMARPVHAAAAIESPEALGSLLRGFDPSAACPLGEGFEPEAAASLEGLRRALRDAFDRFAASVRPSGRAPCTE